VAVTSRRKDNPIRTKRSMRLTLLGLQVMGRNDKAGVVESAACCFCESTDSTNVGIKNDDVRSASSQLTTTSKGAWMKFKLIFVKGFNLNQQNAASLCSCSYLSHVFREQETWKSCNSFYHISLA
jgi:hypothetical protein